jgi:Protein of unknown function (DUF2752)
MRSDHVTWSRDLSLLALDLAWLLYTRLYFVLHPLGLTVAPSVFMRVTGHPDPLCGLTRTFAWMWRGDIYRAVLVYPLGPLVFVGSWGGLAYLAYAVVTRRTLSLNVPKTLTRTLMVVVMVAVAVNWMSKWLWLGV